MYQRGTGGTIIQSHILSRICESQGNTVDASWKAPFLFKPDPCNDSFAAFPWQRKFTWRKWLSRSHLAANQSRRASPRKRLSRLRKSFCPRSPPFLTVLSQQHAPHLPHQVISGGGEDPSLKLVSNVDSIMEECRVFLVDDPSRWIAAHAAVFPNDLWLCLGSKNNDQWGIEDQPLRWDRSTRKRLLDNKFDLESKMFSKKVFCLPAWWSSCRSGSRLCWLVTRGCFCGATAWYAHQIYEHFEVNGISKSNVISSATFSACSRCVWRESPEKRR